MNLVEFVTTTYGVAEEYRMFPVQTVVQGSCKPFVVDMMLDGVAHRTQVLPCQLYRRKHIHHYLRNTK